MRRAGVGCATVLACLLGACGVAAAADIHPEASFPDRQPHVIARPQAPNWYVLRGGSPGFYKLSVVGVPLSCPSTQPFVVNLFNPWGHFVKTLDIGNFATPMLPGRYLVQVAITDAGCDGARYELVPLGAVLPEGFHNAKQARCNGLLEQKTRNVGLEKLAAASARSTKNKSAHAQRLAEAANYHKAAAVAGAKYTQNHCP